MKNSDSAAYLKVLQTRKHSANLQTAMFMHAKNAETAGQGFTAPADAPQTHIMQQAL